MYYMECALRCCGHREQRLRARYNSYRVPATLPSPLAAAAAESIDCNPSESLQAMRTVLFSYVHHFMIGVYVLPVAVGARPVGLVRQCGRSETALSAAGIMRFTGR